MANYALASYFPIPSRLNGRYENAENGWGAYAWPQGVPDTLRGPARYEDITVEVRTELIPLVEVLLEITDLMGYKIHTHNPNGNGEFWGPWSYENRNIAGTNSASNHSKARALDVNSPLNPQSRTFSSTWPPNVINIWEQCGFAWGGRYRNPTKFDTMHVNYAGLRNEVESDLVRARQLRDRLRGTVSPAAPSAPAPQPTVDGNWPLPFGHFFGPSSFGPLSHNGSGSQAETNYVAEFQDQLNDLGYSAGAPDGRYGSKTQAAATAWQRANGLVQSGLCGRNDYDAIHSTAKNKAPAQPTAPAYGGVPLRRGSKGAAVEVLQARLNEHLHVLGLPPIKVDGDFGAGTEKAVLTYQGVREHTYNLGEPDGVVGPKTWRSMWE